MKLKSVFAISVIVALKAAQLAHAGPYIIGGSEVAANDPIARSTVALIMDGESLCTGSLISNDLIVTAAHCLADQPKSVQIIFANQISSRSLRDALPASRYVVNPAYRGDQTGPDQSDVAIVQFHGGLPAGYKPDRILRDEHLLKNGQDVLLAGYGIADALTQAGAGTLRETQVQIADESFGRTEILLSQQDGHGACHGDSGGPAFLKVGSTLYLWGVTSRAYPNAAPDDCAHEAVYTKIMDNLQFLDQATRALRR